MLVNEEQAPVLAGYLSPSSDYEGFIIPVFKKRASNMLLTQEISNSENVSGFKFTTIEKLEPINSAQIIYTKIGSPAIWGYRKSSGETLFLEKQEMCYALNTIYDEITNAFLRLQVAQFCENDGRVVECWRHAFSLMEQVSKRSANAWRDVIIIPTQVRLSVERTILAFGLTGLKTDLGRSVEVNNASSILNIKLEDEIYQAVINNLAAHKYLIKDLQLLTQAFGLKIGTTDSISSSSNREVAKHEVLETSFFIVVSVGEKDQLFSQNISLYFGRKYVGFRSNTSYLTEFPFRVDIYDNDLSSADAINSEKDFFDVISDGSRPIFFIFSQNKTKSQLEFILPMADRAKTYGAPVVAVIPNLPNAYSSKKKPDDIYFEALKSNFTATWILDDHATNIRNPTSIGPVSSTKSAVNNFALLFEATQKKIHSLSLYNQQAEPTAISIAASADGYRSADNLLDHIISRLTHPSISVKEAKVAIINLYTSSFEESSQDVLQERINSIAQYADVAIRSYGDPRVGANRLFVTIIGINLVPFSSSDFVNFCLRRLREEGWSLIRQDLSARHVQIQHRGFTETKFDCYFKTNTSVNQVIALEAQSEDASVAIVISRAPIRRVTFIKNVLNDIIPIHYEKIDALAHIYRGRYKYVISNCPKVKTNMTELLIKSALSQLRKKRNENINLISKIDTTNISLISKYCEVNYRKESILLTIKRERNILYRLLGINLSPDAKLILDENGWSFLN